MVRSRRVFNQLTDARECLWSVRERVGWDRERGTNSTAYIKAQFVPLCVRFHLIATRWQEVYAHTHAFSLSHSCCLSAIVGVATWPEVEWGGVAHSLSVRVKAISLNLQLLCRLLNNSLYQACFWYPLPLPLILTFSYSLFLVAATFVRHRMLPLPPIRASHKSQNVLTRQIFILHCCCCCCCRCFLCVQYDLGID